MTGLRVGVTAFASFFPVMHCIEESVANIEKIWKILQYIKKVNICFDDALRYIDTENNISILSMYRVITNIFH